MSDACNYFHDLSERTCENFRKNERLYSRVWAAYQDGMRDCSQKCSISYGPQGLYWVATRYLEDNFPFPRILFVGRENYGWTTKQFDIQKTCYLPLFFTQHRADGLSMFWLFIKDFIIKHLFNDNKKEATWNDVLDIVSISNVCKCLSNNEKQQRDLYEQCINRYRYFVKEIEILEPDAVVLLTGPRLDNYIFGKLPDPLGNYQDHPQYNDKEEGFRFKACYYDVSGKQILFLRTSHPSAFLTQGARDKMMCLIAEAVGL